MAGRRQGGPWRSTAEGAPRRENGLMSAGTAPGLGIRPRMDVLGKPVVEVA